MEEEGVQAHLRGLARLPDFQAVCSSAGWTDHSHVLYLSLLQDSFVNQLHGGETSLKGDNLSSSKADRAKSCRKAERLGPPPCSEDQEEDGEVHSISTDNDASTSTSGTAGRSSTSRASAASAGRSSACRSGKRERSPSRTAGSYEIATRSCVASEGSGQNFIDEDVEDSGGLRGRLGDKRLRVCWRHDG